MKDKFLNFVGDLLVRYYMEIIAGIWAVMIMMPIDAALYKKVTGDETYLIDGNFAVMFVITFTIAQTITYFVKKARTDKMNDALNEFHKEHQEDGYEEEMVDGN